MEDTTNLSLSYLTLNSLLTRHFTLQDLLVHHCVIEGIRVFVCKFVWKLATSWLDHVRLTRRGCVVKSINSLRLSKHLFMLDGRILVSNQTGSRAIVALHRDRIIKITHHLIKFIAVDLSFRVLSCNLLRLRNGTSWCQNSLKFSIQSRCFLL